MTSATRRGVAHIHVGELVIGDGKGVARAGVERVGLELVADREQSRFAQHAIDVHRRVHIGDSVLRQHDDPPAALAAGFHQAAADRVDGRDVLARARVGDSVALQVVVEMRQVDEQQRGRVPAIDALAASAIHSLDRNAGVRSPELRKWKCAQLGDEAVANPAGYV